MCIRDSLIWAGKQPKGYSAKGENQALLWLEKMCIRDRMKTVPAKYTAYQGFDALFHNTEVMISKGVNILSETIALSAIENIVKYLPRAVADGNDMERCV